MIGYPYKLLREKDERIAELEAERDRLMREMQWIASTVIDEPTEEAYATIRRRARAALSQTEGEFEIQPSLARE